MKNILEQKATDEQHGRTKYILTYVDKRDIKNKEILDIGCGFGWFEHNMLDNLQGGHIWGIDLKKGDIKTAKNTVKDERIIFQVGSTLNLPFQDEFFDCIVSWDVLGILNIYVSK